VTLHPQTNYDPILNAAPSRLEEGYTKARVRKQRQPRTSASKDTLQFADSSKQCQLENTRRKSMD
jgi:hypothetical protein